MSLRISLCLGLVTLSFAAALAQEATPKKPAEAKIADLAWLAGSWEQSSPAGSTEEHWIAPRGGMMLGTNRTVRKGRNASFEFLRIAESADGIVYFASPAGRPATPFRLIRITKTVAVFSNPKHDFPQTITYERNGDTLNVKITGKIRGTERSMQWKWKRVVSKK